MNEASKRTVRQEYSKQYWCWYCAKKITHPIVNTKTSGLAEVCPTCEYDLQVIYHYPPTKATP